MKTMRLSRASLFLTAALILAWLDGFLTPLLFAAVPGVKLGLANVAVTVCMIHLGFLAACSVGFIRVLTVFLLSGNPVSFAFSMGGLIFSLIATHFALKLPQKYFSMVSVSVISALLFNFGQGIVSVIFFGRAFLYYVPILCILSLPCGWMTGIAINGVFMMKKSKNNG